MQAPFLSICAVSTLIVPMSSSHARVKFALLDVLYFVHLNQRLSFMFGRKTLQSVKKRRATPTVNAKSFYILCNILCKIKPIRRLNHARSW